MKKISKGFAAVLIYLFSQSINPYLSTADTAKYFYDDLGRLTRVVKGTTGTIYNYDDLGNLISVTSATTTASSPTLTSIAPNVLFVGSTSLVTIYGQNLLTTESVTANGGLVDIDDVVIVSDTQITAEMTALSAGTDTIKVTTQNGTPNYAAVGVTLSSSKLTFSPGQLAITPGANGIITASISPSISNSLTISLTNSAPSIATAPQSVTIPVTGTATFTVNAIKEGLATLSSGDLKAVVFVTAPFSSQPGDAVINVTRQISVYIEVPTGGSSIQSTPVTAYIESPSGGALMQSAPVSAYIETTGDSTVMSLPVSSGISPP